MVFDDVRGYVGEGFILCENCGNDDDDELYPIFDSNVHDLESATCDHCGAYFEPLNEEWLEKDYACSDDPKNLRWACCQKCNHQVGYDKYNSEYPDTRLNAIKGNLQCSNCLDEMHF